MSPKEGGGEGQGGGREGGESLVVSMICEKAGEESYGNSTEYRIFI